MIIQKQEWKAFTRYFISNAFGSVMMNLYDKPQECEASSTRHGYGDYTYVPNTDEKVMQNFYLKKRNE